MGVGGTPFSARKLTEIGILFVGFLMACVSLFVGWWAIKTSFQGAWGSGEVKPFSGISASNDPLSAEAMLTGALALARPSPC